MKYFLSAFRVGMLGLEALPRRVDSSHQIKYLRSPSYGENVKWLWGVSVKLGINSLQQFCQTAANVIQNPFLIQELAFDSANFLCRNNPVHFTHALRSPMLNVLVQRCLNSYVLFFLIYLIINLFSSIKIFSLLCSKNASFDSK